MAKFEVIKRYRRGTMAGQFVCSRQVSGKLVSTVDDAKQTFAARCGMTLEALQANFVLEIRPVDEIRQPKRSLVVNWLGRSQCR